MSRYTRRRNKKSPVYCGLRDAFKELRRNHNMRTRLGIGCCNSCIGYELGTILAHEHMSSNLNDDEMPDGWVFFSNQEDKSGRYFSLHYNIAEYYNYHTNRDVSTTDFSTKEIGERIVEICEKHGVDTYWNGDTDMTILAGHPPQYLIDRRE